MKATLSSHGVLASLLQIPAAVVALVANGMPAWLLVWGTAIRALGGRVARWLGTLTVIDHRKRAREALRESEEQFRIMADSSPIVIWVTDAEGNLQFVNHAYSELFGVELERVRGQSWQPLVHPDDVERYVSTFAESLRERRAWTCQARVRRADGEWRWIESRSNPRFSPSGEFLGTVGSSPDVTAQKQAQQALEQAARRKDDFLATLAHELRNPLAAMRYALELLRLGRGDAAAQQRGRELLERQVDHVARLVDDLLDVARITHGQLELRPTRVSLATVLESALDASGSLTAAMGHERIVSLPDPEVVVDADPTRLSQVFVNLLDNAAKYTPRGGRIWLAAEVAGPEVVVTVRDSGIGISADQLRRIFDPFAQVAEAVKSSQGGLGIGLALVKHLVDRHGGTVEAHSDGPGAGATFRVRLPIALALEAPAPPPRGAETVAAAPTPRHRVLVVDDERDSADALSTLLRMLGHEPRVAYGGEEALVATRELEPDLVLLDLDLPELTGYEVCRRIRELRLRRQPSVVALTGFGQPEIQRRAHEAGFDRHLVKPVDLSAIVAILNALPGGATAAQEAVAPGA